jgi:hypothetical protein
MAYELAGLTHLIRGDTARGLSMLRQATAIEDTLPMEFGPPLVVKPSHELLGEALLGLQRPATHIANSRALLKWRRAACGQSLDWPDLLRCWAIGELQIERGTSRLRSCAEPIATFQSSEAGHH